MPWVSKRGEKKNAMIIVHYFCSVASSKIDEVKDWKHLLFNTDWIQTWAYKNKTLDLE